MAPPKKYPKSLRRKGALRTVARCYPDVAAMQPKEYWNDACPIEWGAMDKYEVLQQLGKGKYGEVFEGIDVDAGARCVVKIMRPVKEQRLKREIKILRHVCRGPNIIEMRDLVRDPDTKTPCFVFELVEAVPLRELQVGLGLEGKRGARAGAPAQSARFRRRASEGHWGSCGERRRAGGTWGRRRTRAAAPRPILVGCSLRWLRAAARRSSLKRRSHRCLLSPRRRSPW